MEQMYNQYRALLFTLAYQLTGSATDAEDAVHDVFVKACDIQPEQLEEPKAYFCKMVTNHCLNLMKSARKKREMYVGSVASRANSDIGGECAGEYGRPPRFVVLWHACTSGAIDPGRAHGFRFACGDGLRLSRNCTTSR